MGHASLASCVRPDNANPPVSQPARIKAAGMMGVAGPAAPASSPPSAPRRANAFVHPSATIRSVAMMGVAAFVVHGSDPLGDKELALLYLVCFAAVGALGAGKWSLDAVLKRR